MREQYDREYDLHYMDLDKSLHELVQKANDPRLIARAINRTYNIAHRVASYFLLNGQSFPYTFRESLVVVKPDQKVKLRVLNGGLSLMSLHPHGQALTETHLDGIEVPPAARVTRDVVAGHARRRRHLDAVEVRLGQRLTVRMERHQRQAAVQHAELHFLIRLHEHERLPERVGKRLTVRRK